MFARYTGTQATEAAKPTLIADGINGLPVVRFTTDDFLQTEITPTSSEHTFIFCGKRNSSSTNTTEIFLGSRGSTTTRVFFAISTGKLVFGIGGASVFSSGLVGTSDFIGTARLFGTTAQVYLNGALVGSATLSGTPSNALAMHIGALNDTGSSAFFFTGDMFALDYANRARSNAELNIIHQSLSQRTGIPISLIS
jgi:hypothetical protein